MAFFQRLFGKRDATQARTPDEVPEIDDDLAWLNPPATMHDPAAWDRYWHDQLSHGVNPALFDFFVSEEMLLRMMSAEGKRNVLCAGTGISREPFVLAAAGFDVAAFDSSPLAVQFSRQLHTQPGAALPRLVVGDLLDREVCPGPFDLVIERRTLQLFPEDERAAALDALLARLDPEGILFSHCHDAAWRPGRERSHPLASLFAERGLMLWSGEPEPKPAGRVAWMFLSTG